jgi:hypothetical protein
MMGRRVTPGSHKFVANSGVIYAGICYDGPLEGQWRSEEASMFRCHVTQPTYLSFSLHPTVANINEIYYRWSDPLKAWVALNMR